MEGVYTSNSNDTHLKSAGYVLWIFGFMGSHRFYYGKPITGTTCFFTLGLLLIGWIIDFFLVTLLDELHVLCALVELRIPIAPEAPPEKKRLPQVLMQRRAYSGALLQFFGFY